jgi:hypothetical protein
MALADTVALLTIMQMDVCCTSKSSPPCPRPPLQMLDIQGTPLLGTGGVVDMPAGAAAAGAAAHGAEAAGDGDGAAAGAGAEAGGNDAAGEVTACYCDRTRQHSTCRERNLIIGVTGGTRSCAGMIVSLARVTTARRWIEGGKHSPWLSRANTCWQRVPVATASSILAQPGIM